MKKHLLGVLALFILISSVSGQKITQEKTFQVTGYNINEFGYPLKIVGGLEGAAVITEFWQPTPSANRKYANYYIESYSKKFEEEWYHPITEQNAPLMEPITLIRMKDMIALIGNQMDATTKGKKVMMEGFDLNGNHRGSLQKISIYDKKSKKGFENEFHLSQDSTKLMWMGTNPAAKAKSRRYLCSVWTNDAREVWSKELKLPHAAEGYFARQATVDNKGNAYFLMSHEVVTNTIKDTLNLPWIIRYDFRENKFTEYQLNFPAASLPEGLIHVTEKGDLAFVGILSDGSPEGFQNGAKSFSTPLTWNKIVYKQFDIQRELTLKQEYAMPIPASWLEKYGKDGANFSLTEIREYKGRLFWVMEEHYTQIHNDKLQHLYYDVAIVAINIGSGEIEWANTFNKRQRDYIRGNLLSYVLGVSGGKLHFVYLNERGASGKIVCTSVDTKTGETVETTLASNQQTLYLFFPERSTMVSWNRMMLMGVGNPVGNDFKLIEITF